MKTLGSTSDCPRDWGPFSLSCCIDVRRQDAPEPGGSRIAIGRAQGKT